jgi:hypothetical protein
VLSINFEVLTLKIKQKVNWDLARVFLISMCTQIPEFAIKKYH